MICYKPCLDALIQIRDLLHDVPKLRGTEPLGKIRVFSGHKRMKPRL